MQAPPGILLPRLGACICCCCIACCTCCRDTVISEDIHPSAAAILSKAFCIRAPGNPTWCGKSATSNGVRGAGRASSTAAGSSPRDGRRAMGPMSLLRTTATTHRLSSVDRRLPGLGTLRRLPRADMRAHTPQSLLLSTGGCTCAA